MGDVTSVVVFAHVLLFVFWLGSDLGVFYLSFRVRDRTLGVAARTELAAALLNLDLVPRICLVLMLPVGLSLSGRVGLVSLPGWSLALLWVAGLGWLGAVVAIHRTRGSRRGQLLTMGDGIFRAVLVVTLLVLAGTSLATGTPFPTSWLAAKVGLFALAVACGLGIRIVLRPLGPAFAALAAGDVSRAVEARLASSLRRTYPLVLTIWTAITLAAYLGIAQPW